jgi:D-cysteine desulfhydrase
MTAARRPRVSLGNLPTPLEHAPRLGAELGCELWIKRDDATGGAEAGNKVRKLELLLGDALARGADTVVTCGAVQSNHARATAVAAARLGLRAVLLLRAPGLEDDAGGRGVAREERHAPLEGNVLLDALCGAEVRLITVESYRHRADRMEALAGELRAGGANPYLIPEGGSNGLGALGYVEAMRELRAQLDAGEGGGAPFDVLVHACGSGGTAAGVALGAGRYDVAREIRSMAVCDDAATFERRIEGIVAEARSLDPSLGAAAPWRVDDRFKGPAYGVSTALQRACMARAARAAGLVLDPVYTGKAFVGLVTLCEQGELRGQRVLFLHTGGLPGLLAQASVFAGEL